MKQQSNYVAEPSDDEVEAFVASHEGGASYEEIAEATGLSRQRVQQLCSKALVKALRNAQLKGMLCPEFSEPQESHWDRMG